MSNKTFEDKEMTKFNSISSHSSHSGAAGSCAWAGFVMAFCGAPK